MAIKVITNRDGEVEKHRERGSRPPLYRSTGCCYPHSLALCGSRHKRGGNHRFSPWKPGNLVGWHRQIEHFADRYHIIAPDLKGYGQSDKRHGDWRWENVAEEMLALLDQIGLEKFNVVAHDRGAVLADYMGGNHPERILRYVRMQQIAHIFDPEFSPQAKLFGDPIRGPEFYRDPEKYYELRISKMLKKPLDDAHKERILREFAFEGLADAVPRYFQSSSFEKEWIDRKTRLFPNMNFPVLLLYGDSDGGQPTYYYDDPKDPVVAQFSNARFQWIEGAGHYTTIENPDEINKYVGKFLSESL